jgi:hypothetical protein
MLQQMTDVLYTPPHLAAIDGYGPAPEQAYGRCTITQQHRSSAAFLVVSDEAAAIIEQIAGNQERCLQVLFFIDALTEQPDAADPATESQPS